MFKFKRVIITGGSSGIGKATALKMTSLGAHVFIIARNIERLGKAVEDLEKRKIYRDQIISMYQSDIRDYNQLKNVCDDIIGKYGAPDIIIASAGITYSQYFDMTPIEVFRDVMDTNYFGVLYTLKVFLPSMFKEAKEGYRKDIVVISSLAAVLPVFGYIAYSPSKAAVTKLVKDLEYEYKPYINFHVVYPPDTDTPMLRKENEMKPLETFLIDEKAGVMSAEDVAESIMDGLIKNKKDIYPGNQLLIRFVNRFMPRVIDRIITRAHNYVEELRKQTDGKKKIEKIRNRFQEKFKVD